MTNRLFHVDGWSATSGLDNSLDDLDYNIATTAKTSVEFKNRHRQEANKNLVSI